MKNRSRRLAGNPRMLGAAMTDTDYELAGVGPQIGNTHGVPFATEDPTEWRRQFLPMSPLSLTTGTSGTSSASPQEIAKVKKINIPEPLDPATSLPVAAVNITGIRVGQKNQLIADGQIDARCLIPDAVNSFVDFDTLQVGNTFAIDVTNGSAVTVAVTPLAICLVAV